jgi:hypothetical protein
VLVAGLALPFILHQNAWYEWANALWLLKLQVAHVAAHGLPTYFIDAGGQYFYPQQLFYAGPMLAALAYPALVLGSWPVFAAAAAASFGAASAGVSWAARNLGVPPGLAVVPGVLFACTPYTVSNLYGRGDWAELVATAGVALSLGAATSLLTARRTAALDAAALAASVAIVAGTHNLTLLLGALLAPLLAVALAPLLRVPRRELGRRLAWVLAGALIGLALCGAFLVPNVWLGGRTIIGRFSLSFLNALHGFERPGTIFDPFPGQPSVASATDLHTQTIVVALVWLLIVGAVAALRHRLERRVLASLGLLLLLGIGLALLTVNPSWWQSFPHVLTTIQFTFRMVTFLALVTVLAIAALLTVPAVRRNHLAISLLLVATVWQAGLAVYLATSAQARGGPTVPTPARVRVGHLPSSFASDQQRDYRLVAPHPLAYPAQRADVKPVGNDSPPEVHLYGSQPPGSLVRTTIVSSPLVRVAGDVTVAGETFNGFAVLRVRRSPWTATVSSVCSTTCLRAVSGRAPIALLAGRVLSVLGALLLAGLAVSGIARRRRARAVHGRAPPA